MILETLKQNINGILNAINELSAKAENVAKDLISQTTDEEIELGIHMMDISLYLKKAKEVAKKTGSCLEKH